jgi:hypothetical protein
MLKFVADVAMPVELLVSTLVAAATDFVLLVMVVL